MSSFSTICNVCPQQESVHTKAISTHRDLLGADSNTLALLVRLLDPQLSNTSHHLLIVGAYRDNEVDATHPLSMTLGEVNRKGGKVEDIPLVALSEAHVIRLVEDTFNTNTSMSSTPSRAKVVLLT